MSLINRRTLLVGALSATFSASPALAQWQPTTALIFVAASWCPVCKRAAPMLDVFARRHDLNVLVASLDARPIEPFPSFVDARSHPLTRGIDRLPTTLVFSASQDSVVGGFEGYRNPQTYLGALMQLVREAEALS